MITKKSVIKAFGLCLITLTLLGCREMNVKEVTSRLKIGMTKAELDTALKDQKFLKEQVVKVYPGRTEEQTRGAIQGLNTYKLVYPDTLFQNLPVDSSIKVFSYLVKEEQPFANPVYVDSLAIFYDTKSSQVIGWGHMTGLTDVRYWDDRF